MRAALARRSAALGALALLAAGAAAHPGCGILVGADGAVWVVGGTRGGLFRIAPDGEVEHLPFAGEAGTLANPHQLVRGPGGTLVSASDDPGVAFVLRADGTLAPLLDPPRAAEVPVGRWGDPFAVGPDGSLFVVAETPETCRLLRLAPDGELREHAGGPAGHADGPRGEARLVALHGGQLLALRDGSLLLTDRGSAVRRVAPDGAIVTLAGGPEPGFRDARGADARFRGAMGIALAPDGAVLVADSGNRRVRRVAPDGEVTTFAGSGARGSDDGDALAATFDVPAGVAADGEGRVYVLDWSERTWPARVRVVEDERVRTLAVLEEGPAAGGGF